MHICVGSNNLLEKIVNSVISNVNMINQVFHVIKLQ